MADSFDEIAALCRAEHTSRRDVPSEHLNARLCYLGEGRERVYCLLALIEDNRGCQWFAYVLATDTGELEAEFEPLAKWSVARQLNACTFRGKFAELEPKAVADVDADGYIFRGPKFPAQNSEPKPGCVVPSGFVAVPTDHG